MFPNLIYRRNVVNSSLITTDNLLSQTNQSQQQQAQFHNSAYLIPSSTSPSISPSNLPFKKGFVPVPEVTRKSISPKHHARRSHKIHNNNNKNGNDSNIQMDVNTSFSNATSLLNHLYLLNNSVLPSSSTIPTLPSLNLPSTSTSSSLATSSTNTNTSPSSRLPSSLHFNPSSIAAVSSLVSQTAFSNNIPFINTQLSSLGNFYAMNALAARFNSTMQSQLVTIKVRVFKCLNLFCLFYKCFFFFFK